MNHRIELESANIFTMPFVKLYDKFQPKLLYTGAICTILLIFVIPFSTALTTVFSLLIFFIWLLSGQLIPSLILLKRNPTALFAFALFIDLGVATIYSSAPSHEAWYGLKKYYELILLVTLFSFLYQEKLHRWALYAWILSLMITLFCSYAIYFDVLSAPTSAHASSSLKMRITHSLFIALFSFYCAHQILDQQATIGRIGWIILFLLSTVNLFFMIDGRTGQLIYVLLIFLLGYQRLSQFKAMILMGLNILFVILFVNFGHGSQRIQDGLRNSQSYLQGHTETQTSVGQRLTFWKHALTLIAEKPILGHGTGSFASQYARVATAGEIRTGNAHSEFLMLGVQTGFLGLSLFIGFLVAYYRQQIQLIDKQRWFAQGVLLALIVNSLINSTILDHSEGHWFACLIALTLAPLNYTQFEPETTKSC